MTTRVRRLDSTDQQPITIDEAAQAYPGKWMLIKVTARDKYEAPAEGIVVAVGPTSASLHEAILDHLVRRKPDASYYLTSGYRRIRTPEAFHEIVNRVIQQEEARETRRRSNRRSSRH